MAQEPSSPPGPSFPPASGPTDIPFAPPAPVGAGDAGRAGTAGLAGGIVNVRRLSTADIGAAARLHAQMADIQFIARGGPPLLRQYYRAWMSTGSDISLGAFDAGGGLVGVLLGSWSPAAHYRAMLRRGGWRVALGMVLGALNDRRFARELVQTRALRYGRALVRRLAGLVPGSRARGAGAVPRTGEDPRAGGQVGALEGGGGEITHMVVTSSLRRTGAGRALVDAAVGSGRQHGLSHMELVTVPGSGAAAFYERLGWEAAGELATSSGERFVRYRYRL